MKKNPVSKFLFYHGLCLPSGCSLTNDDLSLISTYINKYLKKIMKKYFSKTVHAKLLHIVFKKNDFAEIKDKSRNDLIDVDQFLQLSALNLKKNQNI